MDTAMSNVSLFLISVRVRVAVSVKKGAPSELVTSRPGSWPRRVMSVSTGSFTSLSVQ